MPEFSVTVQLWPVVCACEFFMKLEQLLPGCKSPLCAAALCSARAASGVCREKELLPWEF